MSDKQQTEYAVADVVRLIRAAVEDGVAPLWVLGELSNVARPRSGHIYMTIKDASAQLSAVIWRGVASRLRFDLTDGLQVRVFGRVTVYEPRGQLQMVVDRIEPKGVGALELAFRQLHERLKKEGLFDESHKKPLPFLPAAIGIVTSPTGAAIRDMLNVIETRYPKAHVRLRPVRVQGKGAAEEIAAALDAFNQDNNVDVIIAGRGGGSLEDLWAFNEEIVARAIHASQIPVISAVGHEIDISISDLVADVRALTPTDAGNKVVPIYDELVETLRAHRTGMERALRNQLDRARQQLDALTKRRVLADPLGPVLQYQQRLDELAARTQSALRFIARQNRSRLDTCASLLKRPAARLQESRSRLDAAHARLATAATGAIATRSERLKRAESTLAALNPLAVLARGYSITTGAADGKAITHAAAVAPGTLLKTRLHQGSLLSKTTEIMEQTDGEEASG